MKDWMNQEVAVEEHENDQIKVWNVEDESGEICGYSSITVRSLQDLMSTIDGHLEGFDEDQLRDGVTITIKLKDMTLGDYQCLPE